MKQGKGLLYPVCGKMNIANEYLTQTKFCQCLKKS